MIFRQILARVLLFLCKHYALYSLRTGRDPVEVATWSSLAISRCLKVAGQVPSAETLRREREVHEAAHRLKGVRKP